MPEVGVPHDMATTQAKLENFQCQLVSLEMSLRNVVRMRIIPDKEYQARVAFIERIRRRLEELRAILSDQTQPGTEADIGFPKADQCSLEELRICDDYIARRLFHCEHLYASLTAVHQWVARALAARDGIRSIFRLSKLKKWLQGVENDTAKTELEEKELERMTERLSMSIKSREDSTHLSGNLEALVRIFREIDTLGHRIGNIQSSLARHDERIGRLREWLARYEGQVSERTHATEIPSLQKIQEAKDELAQATGDQERENRLTLARRFVESCLPDEDSQQMAPSFEPLVEVKRGAPHAH